jgi:predicted Holliday junction resolvase-like endonuclease
MKVNYTNILLIVLILILSITSYIRYNKIKDLEDKISSMSPKIAISEDRIRIFNESLEKNRSMMEMYMSKSDSLSKKIASVNLKIKYQVEVYEKNIDTVKNMSIDDAIKFLSDRLD